nr:MAG TPA: hypothetical protein [Caudoviricetes sp.]
MMCKWMKDEVCVNGDCPAVADFCPVVNHPGVCRYEENELCQYTAGSTNKHTRARVTGANGGICDGRCEVFAGKSKNV